MGDPSGIGPAVIAKAFPRLKGIADFTVIGDKGVFQRLPLKARRLSSVKFIDLRNVRRHNFQFGKVRAEYARASIEYLDRALDLIKEKAIDCLVTSPVSKEAISSAGFKYHGHTEYFAERTNTKYLAMMLLNKTLKTVLVTRHVALKDVPSKINKDAISKAILLAHSSLKRLFSIQNPKIAVCGLNPHASDNGLIGNEENSVIAPVIRRLKSKLGIQIDGPLSADVAVYKTGNGEYDCVIAMYHDQALIPLKLCGSDSGVNLTLGLPFIRTSPLHGTAFDIAGNFGLVNPNSLIAAVKLAIRCTLNLKKD